LVQIDVAAGTTDQIASAEDGRIAAAPAADHDTDTAMNPGRQRAVRLALAIHAVCTLPLILLGTLAVGIRQDLHFGTGAQGIVAAGLVLIAASATAFAGRFVDGPRGPWALAVASALTAVALAGAAALPHSFATLVPFMALAGVALGIAQPATDAFLHGLVPRHRQGRIFSLKQAIAGPGIGLIGGLAVPATAALGGWRAAFAVGAILAGAVALIAAVRSGSDSLAFRRSRATTAPSTGGRLPTRPLLWLATAGGVATAPQAAFLAFAVSSATDAGLGESVAGVVFSLSCALAISARLLLGRYVDRRGGSILGLVIGLLLASVAGFLSFGIGWPPAVLVSMPLLAATAWGWHGLFFLVAVRTSPGAPGRASGMAGAGVLVGAVAGPLLLGLGAEWSYAWSWVLAAGWSLAGAGCMVVARRSIVASLEPH
jgi:MFS family permease